VSALDLYQRTRELGIRLEVVDGRVAFDAPAGVVTPQILEELRSSKAELLDLLSNPGSAARRLWAETLKEIAQAWVERVAQLGDDEKDRLWLDEEVDAALQANIKDAILSENLDRTLDAVSLWREAWVLCVRGDQNGPETPCAVRHARHLRHRGPVAKATPLRVNLMVEGKAKPTASPAERRSLRPPQHSMIHPQTRVCRGCSTKPTNASPSTSSPTRLRRG
jgi:hypothetical protein